ncbi:MAG: DNA translocase FtsK [Anaerovibrio sp.]|uniref:DNA translocase FtsK n=1 Tax=Anaerovibrio sp. TaxID=1872532 RepID=UPI0025F6BD3E|nr:DNA translocase FtsK [Anaerovibrio sp.]MCR5176311.1 DNA translocase FtsK [Anaerovibrio sp.]
MQKKVTKKGAKRTNNNKNKSKSTNKKNSVASRNEVEESTRKPEIIGIIFVAIGLISICGMLGFNVGYMGYFFAQTLKYFLGIGAAVVALLFVVCGGYYIMQHQKVGFNKTSIGVVCLLISLIAMYHHLVVPMGEEIMPSNLVNGGGIIGGLLVFVLHKPLGSTGTLIFLGAAIIGSVLLATPWSLAKGIIFTKEASEAGAEVAMDVAEVVYDGAKNVGTMVQTQVGEQVQKLKNKRSFYDQAQDDSFTDDGPVVKFSDDSTKITGDIEPIISTDRSPESLKWQAPSQHVEHEPFDGPDMNATNYTAGNVQPAAQNGDEYISEYAHNAAGKLNNNLNNLDTSGFVYINKKTIPKGTFDNWRLRGESMDGNPADDAMAVSKADEFVSASEPVMPVEPDNDGDDRSEAFEFSEKLSSDTEDNDREADDFNDEMPIVVSSIDELVDDEEEIEDQGEENNGFTIEFSSDNAGESSFTQSLAEDEIENSVQEDRTAEAVTASPSKVDEEITDSQAVTEATEGEGESEQEELPPYEVPDVTLILDKKVKETDDELEREISEKAEVLKKTLADFKVKAKVLSACHGPAVTRYEVKLEPGVKLNKLTSLADDIALSMAASSVRIEQIPNRSTIGIEVPNRKLESVQLREVLENTAFSEAKSNLTVGFGKDISGKAIFANLADMPHLLVAGATGSGKSVCINTLVTSILFKAKPDEVKFIMIDPKMVELSVYNGIPHQMVPVVTDARKAASVLNWAVQEMEKRYGLIAEAGVKNIETYNQYYADDKAKQMPSVVIIIDELADLMMVAPHDVEDAICRLAQKARAAGIYLVLATQRPSVNVITGVIKANIPSRISFAVTSQIDSRTILDSAGAEKLLGKGDMLFKPQTEPKAIRVQGAFVSDVEVERLVESIKQQGHKLEINQEIIDFTNRAEQENDGDDNGDVGKVKSSVDELLRQAVELVMQTGNASASSFQRRYHIGFTRAGRLLDTMEQLKIVGPPQGSKPREILVNEDQAFEIMDNLEEYMKEEK